MFDRHCLDVTKGVAPLSFGVFLLVGALVQGAHAADETFVLKVHPVPVSVAADGVVEAVRQANISAQVPGRVIAVSAEPGQWVKKGQVLLRLDVREANEAYAAADALSIQAGAQLERTQRLFQQKFVSQAALDKAKADADAAAANRKAAMASQSHGVIVAPFNGWVAARPVSLGDQAQPGTPLITVYDPTGLRAVAQLPQNRLAGLKPAREAKLEVGEENGQIRWLSSQSWTVVPAADPATHAAQVRVGLPAGTEGVVPGGFARIHFQIGTQEKLALPVQAVVRRGEVAAAYVQPNGGKKPVLRQLRLGEKLSNGEVEVLAGLVDGDVVFRDPVATAMSLKSAEKAR